MHNKTKQHIQAIRNHLNETMDQFKINVAKELNIPYDSVIVSDEHTVVIDGFGYSLN